MLKEEMSILGPSGCDDKVVGSKKESKKAKQSSSNKGGNASVAAVGVTPKASSQYL